MNARSLPLLSILTSASLLAQAPATSKSVFVDAVESAGDSKTTANRRYIDGTYDKTKVATRELAITLRSPLS